MIKTLAIAAAVAAIAGSATASEIKVSLVGKDDAAISADIRRAAKTLCGEIYRGPLATYEMRSCISETVSATQAKIREARMNAPDQLASAR